MKSDEKNKISTQAKLVFILYLLLFQSCTKQSNLNLIDKEKSNQSSQAIAVEVENLQALTKKVSTTDVSNELSNILKKPFTSDGLAPEDINTAITNVSLNINQISKSQYQKNQQNINEYFIIIRNGLGISENELEINENTSINDFANSITNLAINLNFTTSQDIYLISSIKLLLQMQTTSSKDESKIPTGELVEYLIQKYSPGQKNHSEILTILSSIHPLNTGNNGFYDICFNLLQAEGLVFNYSPEVMHFLSLIIKDMLLNINDNALQFNQENNRDLFFSNLQNFSRELAIKIANKTDTQSIIESISTLDAIFSFIENKMHLYYQSNQDLKEKMDRYWYNDYRFISNKLLENFINIEKKSFNIKITPVSLLLNSILIQKEQNFPITYSALNADNLNILLRENKDSFKAKFITTPKSELNYNKELAYAIYLRSLLSYIITSSNITDQEFKIRDIQNELQSIQSIIQNKGVITSIDDENDFLSSGIFNEENIQNNKNLVIHPLSYVKAQNLNIQLNKVEGGIFDVSANEATGIESHELYLGDIAKQYSSISQTQWQTCTSRGLRTTCDGENRFNHNFSITRGSTPQKANKGISGLNSLGTTIILKTKSYNLPIILANGGQGAKGQTGLDSPYCTNKIYNEIKFRKGTKNVKDQDMDSESFFPASEMAHYEEAKVSHGESGDGGDGGNGGKIIYQIKSLENNNFENKKSKSKLKANQQNEIRLPFSVHGGAGGDAGDPSSCLGGNVKAPIGKPGLAGTAGSLEKL